ncbi:MAG: SMEK domain-containing protein [Chloroflexi bacterium]|nr:SMEK domain-containing protein [Chloroflexota bacterium]MBP8059408.1 SMEK domain-containing protein [Chloroflexota bacterium]
MRLLQSQNHVVELLSRFVTQIKGATHIGRTDINHVAETFLIPLLSEVYNLTNLKNLNYTEEINYPGIDLGDLTARVAIQVTATASLKKVKETLQQFDSNRFYEQYDRLIIYILTEKQKSYSYQSIKEIVQDRFEFNVKQDILDYTDLIREISSFRVEKVAQIERIIEDYLVPRSVEPVYQLLFAGTPIQLVKFLDYRNWLHTAYTFHHSSFRNARNEPLQAVIAEAIEGQPVILGSLHAIPQSHNQTFLVGHPADAQAYDDELIRLVPQLNRNYPFEKAWSVLRSVLMAQSLLIG